MADIDYEIIIDNPTQFLIQLNEQGPAGPAGRDGEQGEPGIGINSIVKSRSEGLVDVYVITYSNGATQEFRVTNGSGISSIEKTATEGLIDTYTIYYTNGENTFFQVTNGQNAIISNASATVDATVGTPSVDVVTGGTQFDRTFQFNFHNLKGEKGDKGDAGGAEWGNVNGDISDQQDLMNLLGGKQDTLSPIEPIYIGQDVLYPAIEPTSSASYYEYRAVKSIPVTAKNATLEDGAEFNHLNSIPFEFDKVYKLPTGSADNIYGYDVLGISYKFGKYNSTLGKVVPIASFGKMTTQVYRLPSDNDGDVEVNASTLISTSNTAISDIANVRSSNMYVQKVNTSTGIKLYIYGKYNYISSSGNLRVDTIATIISDASGSTAFTDLMKECTFLIECNRDSNHNSYQSTPYYEIEGTLDTITDTSELGEAKYFPTTREAEYGEYGLGVRYDGNKIILDSNNKLTVNENALSISSDISDIQDDIDTINSKISPSASSTDQLQSLSDVQQAILDGIETCASNSLDDLTNDGEARLHALKAYSDNGEVLTDSKGLQDVIKYAHSTFDRSKFTVVGRPTITDDGILTYANPTSSQGLIIPTNLIGKKPFVLKFRATRGTFTDGRWFLGNSNADSIFIGWVHTSSIIRDLQVRVYNDNTSTGSSLSFGRVTITEGKTFDTILSWDGSAYTLKMIDANDRTVYKDTTVESSLPINTNIQRLIELNTFKTGITYDLKQFSITVDGVEVFSGNKTGIDTIKPDNYTVVGTPTISADGVVVNTTSNNGYLNSPANLISSSSSLIEYYFRLKLNSIRHSDITNNEWGLLNGYNFRLFQSASGYLQYRGSTPDAFISTVLGPDKYSAGETLDFYIAQTSTSLYTKITSVDRNAVIAERTDSNLTFTLNPSSEMGLLTFSKSNSYINQNCSADLNYFKIYADGNLVYQPCLKIPYTESKTGSKIVNAIYRDRVNDMAKQFGSANYYTLDEDNGNFTLPQVELYGLIEKAASTVPSGVVQSSTINNIVSLTQTEYDALTTKDSNTFYVITPST